MNKINKLMGSAILMLLISTATVAASVSTSINTVNYTSIPENAGNGFTVTPYLASQCTFASTQPALSVVGHRVIQGETWAINSTTLPLWCKSEPSSSGANFITTTIADDASINGSSGITVTGTVAATQSGTWNINNISGVISLPTGAATNAGITGISSKTLTDINTTLGTPLQAGGSVVVTSAPSTAVTGTFWQATQPVSAASLPLPTGASTNAGITGISSKTLTDINTTLGTPFQAGGSVAQSGTWNITNVSGTVSLPTGASTSANQTTANSSLSTIVTNTGKIPSLGLAATSASAPIVPANTVITSISSTITVGGTSQTLRTANASDREIEIYNNDSTEPLCINPTGGSASTSASGNICIAALGYYSTTLNNQTMTVVATTTAHKYSAFVRQ